MNKIKNNTIIGDNFMDNDLDMIKNMHMKN